METKMTRILFTNDNKDSYSALTLVQRRVLWNVAIGHCVLPNCDISAIGL
jgi:hypothetical protein